MFQSGPQHIVHFNRLFTLNVFILNGLHCTCISTVFHKSLAFKKNKLLEKAMDVGILKEIAVIDYDVANLPINK